MRIISGSHRSRIIRAPGNLPVRPTTDFAKEGLFNVLANYYDFDALKVLDLYSGTGNIAYEFASRGSAAVTAVDVHHGCHAFIKRTAEIIGFKNIRAIKSDVFAFLKHSNESYDVIFADPPFEFEHHEIIPQMVFEKNMLNENGLLIIEHSTQTDMGTLPHFLEKRNYGKIIFSIFGNQ